MVIALSFQNVFGWHEELGITNERAAEIYRNSPNDPQIVSWRNSLLGLYNMFKTTCIDDPGFEEGRQLQKKNCPELDPTPILSICANHPNTLVLCEDQRLTKWWTGSMDLNNAQQSTGVQNSEQNSLDQSSSSTPEGFTTYDNPKYGVSILYPKSWEVDTKNYAQGSNRYTNLVTFYSPLENHQDVWRDYVLIGFDRIPYQVDLNEYLTEAIDLYKASENFHLVSSSANATLSGLSAYKATYTDREGDPPIDVKITETAAIVDGDAYYLRYTDEENSYSDYLPIFDQMVESFQITGGLG